jgi:hypothetical protein
MNPVFWILVGFAGAIVFCGVTGVIIVGIACPGEDDELLRAEIAQLKSKLAEAEVKAKAWSATPAPPAAHAPAQYDARPALAGPNRPPYPPCDSLYAVESGRPWPRSGFHDLDCGGSQYSRRPPTPSGNPYPPPDYPYLDPYDLAPARPPFGPSCPFDR